MRSIGLVGSIIIAAVATLSAQKPLPFPQPGQRPAPPVPAPAQPPIAQPADIPQALIGIPIYPGAQFITSYDAGRGQRFFLYGAAASYSEMVLYYRTVLKQRGNELFELPPTHQFELGRFRDETMSFPPSVTIKDYTWAGSTGYPNPKQGVQPERFPTVIQIVPPPPGAPQ